MGRDGNIEWWKRLLGALASTTVTLVACIAVFVWHDLKHNPGHHWGNGGEEQIAGFLLIACGFPLLITFFLVIVPLVLLLPARIQLDWWPAMMGFAALVPMLMEVVFLPQSPSAI